MTGTAAVDADLAEALAEHAATAAVAAIPERVLEDLCADLVDGLAACLGGLHASGVDATREVIGTGITAGDAVVFGTGLRWPSVFAAQANATAGHALDYDDVLDEGGGMHAGVPVHCSALALADEIGGVSGLQYLGAVAVGLDVAVRLALAPTEDFGWHRTSAFGIFGVTVAAGRLLGLDTMQMRNALGIAYSQASGNRQCIADGALSKRLQSGFGARDGITAVRLAQKGLTGASRIFEGANGFYPLYQRGRYNRETVTDGLGEAFLSSRIALKPYPCGRNLHQVIDAALALCARSGGRGASSVSIGVGARTAASANRSYPQDVVQAQFNLAFAVATALAQGTTRIAAFAEPGAAPAVVKQLFAATTIVAWDGAQNGAERVEVTYADGSSDAEVVSIPPGNPARPLSPEALRAKFLDCNASSGEPLDDATAARVLELATGMRRASDTRQLTAALGRR